MGAAREQTSNRNREIGCVRFPSQQGILHRDLKPADVLVDVGERPHITEFGLVCGEAADMVRVFPGGRVQ